MAVAQLGQLRAVPVLDAAVVADDASEVDHHARRPLAEEDGFEFGPGVVENRGDGDGMLDAGFLVEDDCFVFGLRGSFAYVKPFEFIVIDDILVEFPSAHLISISSSPRAS